MIRILCLESSTEVCSVALVEDGVVVDSREDLNGLSHSKLLTVFIDELLTSNGLKASDFDALAVSEGPGSYTGLRIGVSAAKGFCYAAGLPLIAISPLKAMAHYLINSSNQFKFEVLKTDLFAPMIDARRMEVYCSIYNGNMGCEMKVDAVVVDEKSFEEKLNASRVVFFGNGADKCKETIQHENAVFISGVITSSKNMATLAHHKFENNDFVDVAYFEPFYLKSFIATKPKNNVLKF